MFGIIRILLGCVLLVCFSFFIKKTGPGKKYSKYIGEVVLSVALSTALAFVPFENLLVTFSSPEAAYKYVNAGTDVKLVVDGKNSDFVIGDRNGTDVLMAVPKTAKGWKIGVGSNIKQITHRVKDGIVISVYQYKDTEDYYILVYDTQGEPIDISDSFGTEFLSVERYSDSLGKMFVTYYASVEKLDQQYTLTINAEQLFVLER